MRVAWFSPRPPVRSGIAAYTAEVVPALASAADIDVYTEADAFDFVWTHQRRPYDLVVYQLGNARAHDYMWGYLARYPGVVVLHDARLHHARARMLLAAKRADDYRAEFRYDHPDVPPDAAEYGVEGLSGAIYYLWPMLRVPVTTSRMVAVHSVPVARDLREAFPGTCIDTIRMGVPAPLMDRARSERVRRELGIAPDDLVFAAFGKVTPEKRIDAILHALDVLNAESLRVRLLIVGDAEGSPGLRSRISEAERLGGRVHAVGYVPDERIGDFIGAADVCVCLRWPTALETSASWLRCLAAGRPTVISDLPHLADIPDSIALRIDVLDEQRRLVEATRRLASDPGLRDRLARAGHHYWAANHTVEAMAADYTRVLTAAAARSAPRVPELPHHFVEDYSSRAREIARTFGADVDIL